MDQLDLKLLKKLADVCRKAGIKHYKCESMEFTLSDEPMYAIRSPRVKASKDKPADTDTSTEPQLGELTPEQLLMWSSTPLSHEVSS